MIVFDLACAQGHVFEAWFGSSAAFAEQRTKGLVSCPVCGEEAVEKAVMAPAISPKGNRAETKPARPGAPMAPAAMKAMLAALAQAQAKMLEGSEHVGRRFTQEARAIHAGDAADRPIHGQASIADAKALADEGIAVAPLPLPLPPPAGTAH